MTKEILKTRVRLIDGLLIDELEVAGGREAFYRWAEQQIDTLNETQAAFLGARDSFTTPRDFGRLLQTAKTHK